MTGRGQRAIPVPACLQQYFIGFWLLMRGELMKVRHVRILSGLRPEAKRARTSFAGNAALLHASMVDTLRCRPACAGMAAAIGEEPLTSSPGCPKAATPGIRPSRAAKIRRSRRFAQIRKSGRRPDYLAGDGTGFVQEFATNESQVMGMAALFRETDSAGGPWCVDRPVPPAHSCRGDSICKHVLPHEWGLPANASPLWQDDGVGRGRAGKSVAGTRRR